MRKDRCADGAGQCGQSLVVRRFQQHAVEDLVRLLAFRGGETVFLHVAQGFVHRRQLIGGVSLGRQGRRAGLDLVAQFEQVLDKWDKIDILVNNAGIIRDSLLATMDQDAWQDVIDTNLTGVYNFCHAVVRPMMSARYGRIVNMSSVAADVGNPGQSNYAASKGGIEGFTRCLAAELGRRNITVNAVAPGFIETDMTSAVRNAAGDQIRKRIPARRIGQPEDVAGAVLFLVSDEASYITGLVVRVDGGLTLGGF